jgi:hypothetical protein
MSALRKKIAEKKKAEEQAAAASRAAEPPSVASDPPSTGARSERAPQPLAGFLSRGALYPEGSNEGAPELWRSKQDFSGLFQLITTPTEYEVRGAFREAGRYLGKEDFAVERADLSLRIKGNPQGDAQSLVAGLDETIAIPMDAGWEGVTADYSDNTLSIRIPRSPEVAELLSQMSLEEAKALAAKLYGAHQEQAEESGASGSAPAPSVTSSPASEELQAPAKRDDAPL